MLIFTQWTPQGLLGKSLPKSTYALLFRRTLRLQHLSPRQVQRAREEGIPYFEYALLQREKSIFDKSRVENVSYTQLKDFHVTIKQGFSSNSDQNYRSLRRRGPEGKLEALFVLLLHSLHENCSTKSSSFLELNIKLELSKNGHHHNQVLKTKTFDRNIKKLISLYSTGNDKPIGIDDISSNLKQSLTALLMTKEYDFQEITKWMDCISALNVTDACFALYGSYKLPLCILNDILMRVPTSLGELELMNEILGSFETDSSLPFETIENIVHYTKMFDIENLLNLLKLLIKKQSFNENQLNRLISLISDTSLNSFSLNGRNNKAYLTTVVESQKLVYEVLLSQNQNLNNLGKLSIGLTILPLSRNRSLQILDSIERQDLVKKDTIEMYNVLKISLEESPTNIIRTVDSIINTNEMTSRVWTCFLNRIKEFNTEVFKSSNVKALLKRYSSHNFMIQSQSQLHKQLKTVESIIKTFNGETNYFDNRSIALLIQRLYNSPSKQFHPNSYLSHFNSSLSYARYIFAQLSKPSALIIGKYLLGESKLDHKSAYSNYVQYLNNGPTPVPNENYVESLLIPAILDEKLKWKEQDGSIRYAAQVAVHEFRKYFISTQKTLDVKSSPYQRSSDSLWRYYILLCGRSDYQDELAEILPFWEHCKFFPNRKTLAMLLGALPYKTGEIIRHHALEYLSNEKSRTFRISAPDEIDEKANFLGKYNWPTQTEIQYWRDKMLDDSDININEFLE